MAGPERKATPVNVHEDPAYRRLPEHFRAHPQAYDVWQAYGILAAYAPERWRDGWSFGFLASLAFPETEIDGIDLFATGKWRGLAENADTVEEKPAEAGTFFSRFAYPSPPPQQLAERTVTEEIANDSWLRLNINLPGVLGPGGPMPLHFSETVVQERHEGNPSLQDFLDLLQNRLMRLWMEEISVMCSELGPVKREADDLPLVCALALCGMLVGGLKDNPQTVFLPGPPWRLEKALLTKAFTINALLWVVYPPSAIGVETLIQKCLGVKTTIEQFRTSWRELPTVYQARLGRVNSHLGNDAILGRRIFDPCAGVTLGISAANNKTGTHSSPTMHLGVCARLETTSAL